MSYHQNQPQKDPRTLVEEATFDFAMGDSDAAIAKLRSALEIAPDSFEAWHALTEIELARGNLDAALAAGEKAVAIRPDDIHIHTSLSRIWVSKGDKAKAEHYGAQARILGWKEQINTTDDAGDDN